MPTQLVTFGCRLNVYESEVMRGHAAAAGLDNAIIFNTCAVTAEAERQARQAIRRARRENPTAKIIVTGCAAQIKPDFFAGMDEIDHIIGNDVKLKPETYASINTARLLVNDIMAVRETAGFLTSATHEAGGFDGRTRAFLQVQNGCDHRCTFCIIPYGRGPSRSVAPADIIAEVQRLVDHGYEEVVLTGVDVTSYGHDLPSQPTLGQMMQQLLQAVPALPRLRLSSLDPSEVDAALWDLIATEPRLMPHLHLSLQAGDDLILKRMKRRHTRQQAIDFCTRARHLRPDMIFGADLIAGFPTETTAQFENSLTIIDECGLTWLHIFPYSARTGTPAAKMPQVAKLVRQQRAAALRAKGAVRVAEFLSTQVGKTLPVLVEKNGFGHTPQHALVKINGQHNSFGLKQVKIVSTTAEHLVGDVC